MRRITHSLLLLLVLFVTACGVNDPRDGRAIVTVGKRMVTSDQLKRDIRRMFPEAEITPDEWTKMRRDLVEKLLDHYRILEYGREKGITASEEEVASAVREIREDYGDTHLEETLLRRCVDLEEWTEGLREQILMRKIIDRAMDSVPLPTEEEVRTYFHVHAQQYTQPPRVKVRQTITRTRKEAQDLSRRLAGGAKMEEVAREYSISPDAKKGGDMGWVGRGEMEPSMEKVVFSLQTGQISPIMESARGYHLFQVVSKHPGGTPFLPEVAMEIQRRLASEKEEAFFVDWIRGLRDRIPVTLNEDLLNRLEWSK